VVGGVSTFIEHTKFRACVARMNVANTADKHFRDILPFALTSTFACLPQLNYPSEEGPLRQVADGILYLVGQGVKKNYRGNIDLINA
jgi:hypothetical protein